MFLNVVSVGQPCDDMPSYAVEVSNLNNEPWRMTDLTLVTRQVCCMIMFVVITLDH